MKCRVLLSIWTASAAFQLVTAKSVLRRSLYDHEGIVEKEPKSISGRDDSDSSSGLSLIEQLVGSIVGMLPTGSSGGQDSVSDDPGASDVSSGDSPMNPLSGMPGSHLQFVDDVGQLIDTVIDSANSDPTVISSPPPGSAINPIAGFSGSDSQFSSDLGQLTDSSTASDPAVIVSSPSDALGSEFEPDPGQSMVSPANSTSIDSDPTAILTPPDSVANPQVGPSGSDSQFTPDLGQVVDHSDPTDTVSPPDSVVNPQVGVAGVDSLSDTTNSTTGPTAIVSPPDSVANPQMGPSGPDHSQFTPDSGQAVDSDPTVIASPSDSVANPQVGSSDSDSPASGQLADSIPDSMADVASTATDSASEIQDGNSDPTVTVPAPRQPGVGFGHKRPGSGTILPSAFSVSNLDRDSSGTGFVNQWNKLGTPLSWLDGGAFESLVGTGLHGFLHKRFDDSLQTQAVSPNLMDANIEGGASSNWDKHGAMNSGSNTVSVGSCTSVNADTFETTIYVTVESEKLDELSPTTLEYLADVFPAIYKDMTSRLYCDGFEKSVLEATAEVEMSAPSPITSRQGRLKYTVAVACKGCLDGNSNIVSLPGDQVGSCECPEGTQKQLPTGEAVAAEYDDLLKSFHNLGYLREIETIVLVQELAS